MVTKNRLLIKWQEELESIVVLCVYLGHKRSGKRCPELPIKHTIVFQQCIVRKHITVEQMTMELLINSKCCGCWQVVDIKKVSSSRVSKLITPRVPA